MRVIKELIPYLLIIIVVLLVRLYIVTPVRVNGPSMLPTLKNNEIVLLKKYDKSYERFDIVIFEYQEEKLVKRVIGLPGEKVQYQDGILYINDEETNDYIISETENFTIPEKIPENCYFVMGDNRYNSLDSRIIGPVCEENIIGSTNFAVFPFNKFGKIK